MRLAPAVLVLLVLAAPVRADDPPPESAHRSPALALGLSLAGTGASLLLLHAGYERDDDGLTLAGVGMLQLGPSLGPWYSGKGFTDGLLVRAGGTAAYLGAVAWAKGCGGEPDRSCLGPILLGLTGLSGIIAGAGADIIDAPTAARDFNRRHQALTIVPAPIAAADGLAPGLVMSGTF